MDLPGGECTGDGIDELDEIERESRAISGTRLCDLAGRITQVIWGEFYGRQLHEKNATLIVKAIDSTLWEVFGDEKCLSLVRAKFSAVKPAAYELG
jgi:L-alanine-DL-glutamate epimerase-like enolase superfamily enzyme